MYWLFSDSTENGNSSFQFLKNDCPLNKPSISSPNFRDSTVFQYKSLLDNGPIGSGVTRLTLHSYVACYIGDFNLCT